MFLLSTSHCIDLANGLHPFVINYIGAINVSWGDGRNACLDCAIPHLPFPRLPKLESPSKEAACYW